MKQFILSWYQGSCGKAKDATIIEAEDLSEAYKKGPKIAGDRIVKDYGYDYYQKDDDGNKVGRFRRGLSLLSEEIITTPQDTNIYKAGSNPKSPQGLHKEARDMIDTEWENSK